MTERQRPAPDPRVRIEAEEKAGYYLHLANLASESGDSEKATRYYERAQEWQDQMNSVLGND